jgi:hypothetical protein
LSRYIIFLIEIEACADINLRIYIAACLTKSLKTAKEELQSLTSGIKGIGSVTFNPITSATMKPLQLDSSDTVK